MLRITFTAARSLTGSHVVGTSVELLLSAESVPLRRRVERDVQKSLGGNRETMLHNAKRSWSVMVPLLSAQIIDQVIEFLDSCEGGEAFTFEPYYVATGPSLDMDFVSDRLRVAESVSAKLESEGYDLSVLGQVGGGGADDYYAVPFTVIEA